MSMETSDMTTDTPTMDFEAQQKMVLDFINGLTTAFGVNGTAEIVGTDEMGFEVNLAGEPAELGLLIGPRGRHISALHEVCKTMMQRKLPAGSRARLRVDVGGYRQRRREALAAYVRELAEGVKANGTERGLEPMSAADRKVVHDVINDIDGVTTLSVGDEPRRRVVVSPSTAS